MRKLQEIFNKDENLKDEVIKMFLDNFSALALHNHYRKTDLVELKIDLEPVHKISKVRPLNPDQKKNLTDQKMSGQIPSTH